jgi:hypothetical protein
MYHTNKKMKNNISIKQEPISLGLNKLYFVIDALYLNDIKAEIKNLDVTDLINEIKKKVFPYTDTPFALYKTLKNEFKINNIKKVENEDLIKDKTLLFSSDTGLIIFIEVSVLNKFIELYDYDLLVNSDIEALNIDYWHKIVLGYDYESLALILSTGVNSGIEFEGSGLYQLETSN